MPPPLEHSAAGDALGDDEAMALAEVMAAFATPSRLKLLSALATGECSVDELAYRAGVAPSAASQQLRVLRHLRMVTSRRDGRRVLYRLHDAHVHDLLGAVRAHAEHVRHGWIDPATSPTGRVAGNQA